MANPKAAQEPSMEEILASIRQIISEDGESPDTEDAAEAEPAHPDLAEPEDETPLDAIAAADEAAEDVIAEDDDESDIDFAAEAAVGPEPVAEDYEVDADNDDDEPDEEPHSELSAAGFDTMDTPPESHGIDEAGTAEAGSDESPFQALEERAVAAQDDPEHDEPEHDEPEHDDPVLQDDVTLHASFEDGSAQQSADPAATAELDEYRTHGQPSERSESQAMTATAPKPAEYASDDKLISADAGASVANAFSSLTHTILSQNARTLDDLVSDMLQPMLKEWLDDNLPTLVERLVKQEIDRMARGGRP